VNVTGTEIGIGKENENENENAIVADRPPARLLLVLMSES